MKMLRFPAIAAAVSLLVAAPAFAQAPISQGRTSSSTQLQANNADLRLKVVDLEAENAQLTGEVETLRFLLNESRGEIEQLQADDKEIARELSALNAKIGQLSSKVQALESGSASGSSGRYTSNSRPSVGIEDAAREPTQSVTRSVTTTGGPRNISGSSSSSTRTVTVAGSQKSEGTASSGADTPRVVTSGNAPAQTGSLGTISASDLPGAAGPLFAEAKSRLTQFDHAGAEEAFRSFLAQFGDDPQAGEAQYWLGETLYQQGAYAEAGAAYTEMIQRYPNDLRAPDALVKLARAMRLVGESEKACAALAALPKRYPKASAVTKNLAAVEATRASCG